MVLAGHVIEDLDCVIHASTCLLRNPLQKNSTFLPVDLADCCEEGCYLYFDTNNSCWIRSGKAVGRNFTARHREHEKQAMLEDEGKLSSRFYRTYPVRNSKYSSDNLRRGYFDHLQLYCGLGFDRASKSNRNLTTSGKRQSLFLWPDSCLRKVKLVNFRGLAAEDLEERQRHMVGYLCELAYDLALSPRNNVSSSPGFETPLGVFGGRREDD